MTLRTPRTTLIPRWISGLPGTSNRGINVTLGVRFDDAAPDVRSMQIEVIGVGLEYSGG